MNLRNFLGAFCFIITACFLSGCFNIVEEITINKDGSGTYSYSIDGSEIKKMVEGFARNQPKKPEADSSAQQSIPSASDPDSNKMERAIRHISSMPGISNAKSLFDSTQMRFGYAFDFDHLDHMVEAIKTGTAELAMGLWNEESKIEQTKKQFLRTYGSDSFQDALMELFAKKGAEEGREISGMEGILKMMLGSMSLKQVYHFPDRKVKNCNHPMAKISKDKHTVTIFTEPFQEQTSKSAKTPATLKIKLK
ncbi:MAG: hypothetical protein JNJ57_11840 [Saprospiraceae bacterium]|nr:hypothetical protein [Saprospiraceae bacterium]